MNKQYGIVFLLGIALFFQNCGDTKQTKEEASGSTNATAATTDVPITDRLAELGLNANNDWRGVNLGDDFAEVKSTEKAELFENDEKHAGYTVEFKNLESADMLYYQANQKVSAIEVDLYLNSRPSVDGFQKDLGAYFNARYGTGKPSGNGMVWTGPKGQSILLKDVSKGKDFGLKISMESTGNGTATALAK
ncbi:hypothetical protein WBJ53_11390 [Spirosoma sp. SC4-14]|uniref:hypothetical protein n=1 Tax=Spirosoma sp. SC4-14 TaxID=3128900 RepID=UPI0030CD3DDD